MDSNFPPVDIKRTPVNLKRSPVNTSLPLVDINRLPVDTNLAPVEVKRPPVDSNSTLLRLLGEFLGIRWEEEGVLSINFFSLATIHRVHIFVNKLLNSLSIYYSGNVN